MVEIKEMPFKEKYEACIGGVKALESFGFSLVKERLGDDKLDELKNILQKQSHPIPEDASYEEKYEIAYRNWMQNWQSAYDLVRNELGESGTDEFIRRAVDYWKKKSPRAALYILNFVRAISPQSAFRTFGKQIAYTWQVYMPFSISEFNGQRMILSVPQCKTLDFEGCEDTCTVACQKLIPLWMKEQFKVKMALEPVGKSCTITFTPL
jgi:hypothetical protein